MREQSHLTDRFLLLVSILIATALPFVGVPFAHADGVSSRYVKLQSALPSAATNYEIGFTPNNTGVPVGSFSLEFCANDPLPNTPCTAPTGFDASAVTLTAQTGEVGFSIDPSSTSNTIIFTRPAIVPTGVAATYELSSMINPSTTGTFYARLQTYTSTDGTGAGIEWGGMAMVIRDEFMVQTEVPPYLLFCAAVTIANEDCSTASVYLIDFGDFKTNATAKADSNILIGTNAANGLSVTISGTTLTSGNNIITPLMPGGGSTTGTSQFGLNLRDNSSPDIGRNQTLGTASVAAPYNIPNIFRFQNGDVIVSSAQPTGFDLLTVSYIANISGSQPAGYYATTITYICLANF